MSIERLMSALPDPHGGLSSLRTALGINYYGHHTFQKQSLSRNKIPALTFKVTHTQTSNSWVVKFSPVDKQNDPWYDVSREYYILNDFQRHNGFPAPKPIYESSASDVKIVGTRFIVMEFVSGPSYSCISEIPTCSRRKALTSVMERIAMVHGYRWYYISTGQVTEYDNPAFWNLQTNTWTANYSRTCGVYYVQGRTDNDLFERVRNYGNTSFRTVQQVIHGDLDISNVVFDHQHNVKVFVDWKWKENGDPMVDVAYFCMMFLRPQDYGHQNLRNLPLLAGDDTSVSEEDLLDVYRQCSSAYDHTTYIYGKVVCCMRLISVNMAASRDSFQNHESGQYPLIVMNSSKISAFLTAAGLDLWDMAGLD